MLSVDAVVAGLGDKDRTHGSRNGLDDDAVAVDNEGMRGGYELPTRPAIETVKQLVDLRAVEAQWREPFMEEVRRHFEFVDKEEILKHKMNNKDKIK